MWDSKKRDMSSSEKSQVALQISQTYNIFLKIYSATTERGIKMLLLANGGGVITLAAYLHDEKNRNLLLNNALEKFITGLLITVGIIAADYFMTLIAILRYKYNLKRFDEDKITYKELESFTCLEKILICLIIIAACLALGYFFAGVKQGIHGYFSIPNNFAHK